MFNCTAVHAVAYYDDQAADAARLAERSIKSRKKGAVSTAAISYYDHLGEDGRGIFVKLGQLEAGASSPFSGIHTGDIADSDKILRLARGLHPETGRPLGVKHKERWLNSKQREAKKVVGYDLSLSPPKGASIVYGLGSPDVRRAVASAHNRAVAAALRFIERQGLIITRSGQDGRVREPAAQVVASLYLHGLSRENDPQIHTHAVIFNLCKRADGSIGAIDNHSLRIFGGAIAALYRCELASILRQELGLEVTRDGRNFALPIVPEVLVKAFSKRRSAIESAARNGGFETAKDRNAAQRAAYATRKSKNPKLTISALAPLWHEEARAAGCDPAAFLIPMEAALKRGTEKSAPERHQPTIDRAALISSIFATEAEKTWPQILCAVAEHVQISATAQEAIALADSIRGELIALPSSSGGDKLFTTHAVVEAEHGLLKTALAARGRWRQLSQSDVILGLKRQKKLNDEQCLAVIHGLNRDGISVINGSAGTGKSFSSAAIKAITAAAGLRLIVTSSSWQATHVIRRDAGVPVTDSHSLARLLARLARGIEHLTAKTVILVDEAGMAPLFDIADLVRRADVAGAKIILVGDAQQLQPVAAGAPMRALADLLGRSALVGIRRQKLPWMRRCSMDLAGQRADRAIDTYDTNGLVSVHLDRSTTLSVAAKDYISMAMSTGSVDHESLRSQLMITPRNRDVAALNALIRIKLQSIWLVEADGADVLALPRAKQEGRQPVSLALAVGDLLIFGERLEVGNKTIFNADVARIMSIDPAPGGPVLTFVLDREREDGQPLSFSAPFKDLVSRFRIGEHPIIQHAYAVTIHASQGATVDRCIVVDIDGLSAEHSYVSMTRHRHDLRVHASAERSLSRGRRETIAVSRTGRLRGTDELQAAPVALTSDERAVVIGAMKASAGKVQRDPNPSARLLDQALWLAADDPISEFKRQMALPRSRNRTPKITNTKPTDPGLPADPTEFSAIERRHLDAIPFVDARVLRRLDLKQVGADRLSHTKTGALISLAEGRPAWSDLQNGLLAKRNAINDHPIVQSVVLMLLKPVRLARAWVRRTFGLAGLNPFATALHDEERRKRVLKAEVESEPQGTLAEQFASREFDVDDNQASRRKLRLRIWNAQSDRTRRSMDADPVEIVRDVSNSVQLSDPQSTDVTPSKPVSTNADATPSASSRPSSIPDSPQEHVRLGPAHLWRHAQAQLDEGRPVLVKPASDRNQVMDNSGKVAAVSSPTHDSKSDARLPSTPKGRTNDANVPMPRSPAATIIPDEQASRNAPDSGRFHNTVRVGRNDPKYERPNTNQFSSNLVDGQKSEPLQSGKTPAMDGATRPPSQFKKDGIAVGHPEEQTRPKSPPTAVKRPAAQTRKPSDLFTRIKQTAVTERAEFGIVDVPKAPSRFKANSAAIRKADAARTIDSSGPPRQARRPAKKRDDFEIE